MAEPEASRASDTAELERHEYDVVVIGAGGAGLRAVIEARQRGLRVAVVCKSLFGKAHTVMAEGGCAAAMKNVCLLYTSPSPRDGLLSRMPSSA